MALEKTLILLRPSALSRGLAGEILSVFYKKVLRICGLKMMLPDENFSGHYFHLAGKNFFRRARQMGTKRLRLLSEALVAVVGRMSLKRKIQLIMQ